jgi:hypothetical protein
MAIKPRPNHRQHLKTLASMTPSQRAQKAFELSEFTKELSLNALRQRFPQMNESQLRKLHLQRLAKCHNRNY